MRFVLQAFLREEGGPRQRWKEPAQPKRCILRIAKNIGVFGAEDTAKQSQDCILISSAAISRQHDISAPSKVTAELLPSAFGVHTKNVSSPLRSGEITNAAIPVFGKAETPPALWRRGVQPGSKNGSRFCSCHSPSMREAGNALRPHRIKTLKYVGFSPLYVLFFLRFYAGRRGRRPLP